jgi:hypothetical protein
MMMGIAPVSLVGLLSITHSYREVIGWQKEALAFGH